MGRRGPNPPRQPRRHLPWPARWILRLLLGKDDRHAAASDLSELYEQRRARDGHRAAGAWLRRQVAQYPYRVLTERWGRRTRRDANPHHPTHGVRQSRESMHNVLRDVRHSVRSLMRAPVLTATIVLTVGLGIGANAAIFGVIDAVLLRPLPYADPGQLVRIYTDSPPNRWPLSVADYLALDEQQTSFSAVAGYGNATMTLNHGDVAARVRGKFVTWTYFSLLGISPLHGRLLGASDDAPGAPRSVVVSHGLWTRYLDGDEAAIGRAIRLNGDDYTVVGVLPTTVGPFEQGREFFAAARWETPPRKGPFFITALARLKDDTEVAVAAEELRAINQRIFPIWQVSYQDARASWGMMDLKSVVIGDVTTPLVIVLGAVGFLLLIASTNVANLLVARVSQRNRELAVRAALGASRGRLLQHLLTESLLLGLGGAALGLALTVGGLELVKTVGGDFLPRTQEIGLNGDVVWFLLAVTVAAGLLFGLIPSMHGTRARFDSALRSGGRSSTPGSGPRTLRRALVVSQFAIAAPLLIGAGLLIGSLARLQRVDPGFDTGDILTAGALATYPDTSDVRRFWNDAFERIRSLPGVRAVAFADGRPPNEYQMSNNFDLEDQPTPPNESQPSVPWIQVTPEYLELLGIPVIEGRWFDERDRDPDAPVAVVDQTWARRFYPNASAVGRRFFSGGCTTCPLFTVVGVVGDVKYTGLDDPGQGTVYYPTTFGTSRFRYFFIRTSTDAFGVFPSVRQILRDLDPTLPLSNVATIDELMIDSLQAPRYLTILVGAFAAVALLLSIVGIYGVMSNFVQTHTKDIGIRIALGGGPSRVMRMIVGRGMQLVGVGVAVGIAGAFILTRYMSSVLFEIGATDTLTFITVSAVMVSVALVACCLPARRAAALDPATTLREE